MVAFPMILLTTARHSSVITAVWVEAIVHISVEPRAAMEPRSCSDEDAAAEPFRPIVPIRRAWIRRVIVIAVGTHRRSPDLNGHLRLRLRRRHHQKRRSQQSGQKYRITLHVEPQSFFLTTSNGIGSSLETLCAGCVLGWLLA